MRILVVGGGGREHALCWAIAASPLCDKLYCAPGNAGIARQAKCIAIGTEDVEGLVAFAKLEQIDYVVVGPEGPLVLGLADRLAEAGIKAFGPSAAAAELEGSKGFMKDLCAKYAIPTAAYGRFTEAAAAKAYIREQGAPIVVKADGLAAGKGVTVAQTIAEAEAAVDAALRDALFGAAGTELVVEAFLEGEEASFFALVDGESALPLASAQDHKQVGDGDQGPNTGGMGAYSPAPVMTEARTREVMERIIAPTMAGMKAEGRPYRGVLYAGLMVTPSDGIKLVEYNVRFGDPECQALMMRLKSDLLPALMATSDGLLGSFDLRWYDAAALTVVMAAQGYPGSYDKGSRIAGLEAAEAAEEVVVFHAGTKAGANGEILANGGRVLGVTALAPGPGPRLPGGRPHRLARGLLPPRHRLARADTMRRLRVRRAALSLPAALLALAGLAGAGQAAAPAAKLAKACIEEKADELLSAGRKLLEDDRDRLAEAAEARPRAFELPALIYIRQGELTAARAWYDELLGRLPEESTSAGLYREALGLLQTQIGLAETSDSRYARAGYSYVGSLSDIEGPEGRTYALVTWRKSPCGFKVPDIEDDARVELFETAAGRRLVRRDEIDPAQGLIEPDAILVQGPDGDPLVSLHVYTGGNCWDCGYRRVFRIGGRSLEEITLPKDSPGPIHRAADLNADGIPEFLAFDGRWQSYRDLCRDCSPTVAAVYRLKNGKAVEACDRFPDF
jgi:phosphoribosylamine--glycine ligase